MTNKSQTTRICIICGQSKPLLAFLEFSGSKSHTYGNVCAPCRHRQAILNQKKENDGSESSDHSGDTSRLQIDTKARIQEKRERKENLKHLNELEHEEKNKKESSESEKISSVESIKKEKNHREQYQELKKQSFLSVKNITENKAVEVSHTETTQNQNIQQEKETVDTEFFNQVRSEELGKKTLNVSPDYIAKKVSSSGRSAESLFGQFLWDFLRNSAGDKSKFISSKTIGQQKSQNTANQTTSPRSTPNTKEQPKTKNNESLAAEFIRNNLKRR